MRTTIDIPDALFRRTKATAALRGSTMKALIIKALENEVRQHDATGSNRTRRVQLPLVHLRRDKLLDLRGFNFDNLLA